MFVMIFLHAELKFLKTIFLNSSVFLNVSWKNVIKSVPVSFVSTLRYCIDFVHSLYEKCVVKI